MNEQAGMKNPFPSTPRPSIGRIVTFRSRTGNYDVPAIITCTVDTLAPVGVELWHESEHEKGVPPLSDATRVHLHVFTPGIPGMRVEAQDFLVEGVRRAENIGGSYQEWDVPLDAMVDDLPEGNPDQIAPGTWRWPERV